MKAKKSLGQHFLTSRTITERIVYAADVQKGDTVLEVGPGKGILTTSLLEKAKKVIAVEKDESLVMFLKEKFAEEIKKGQLELVCDDILEFDPVQYKLHTTPYKLVANIPYYITGALFKKMLSSDAQPKTMVLLVQKQVAERIAKDLKESILSLSVKVYGTPRYIKSVPARYFKPKPKVDSAILLVENISKDFFKNCSEETFFILIKAGFAHKRKMLIRNIEHLYSKNSLIDIFSACDISSTARAENIALEKWECLCANITQDA